MITVMGATGRTGGQIAAALLVAGEAVRVLGRSKDRLASLAEAGAEVMVGDASDATFLTQAFRGSDAVYTLLPYDRRTADFHDEQRLCGQAIAAAVRDSAVSHVVALSSVSADLAEGNGPIASLHQQERRLRAIERVNVLCLRAGAFFENFADAIPMIREQGVLADAYAPAVRVPMVATRDIAQAASQALRLRDWHGFVVRQLLGPRELSYADATRIIGQRIGNPELKYVQVGYEAWVAVLMQAGLSESVAGVATDLARSINEGRVQAKQEEGGAASRMPTRFEDYAMQLAG